MSVVPLLKVWLCLSTAATVAGWLLSALGQLNRAGYAVFAGVLVLALFLGRKQVGLAIPQCRWRPARIRWRLRHLSAAGFAVLAVLVFLAGALYPPNNHTGLTYRVARVLQWLSAEHWHWIHTSIFRMNDRACGIEWLTAPLLLFTRSDRTLFLLNFLPFLFLPGLLFSVFTRLGVPRRAAWYWMWLLPTGYSFLLQSSSTSNDTFPTVYALAAIDFACRAWVSRRPSDLCYSFLAASLLTGAKASNLPLLLPWAILAAAVVIRLKFRVASVLILSPVAALVSFLPTAILNTRYCGDWSGLNLENAGMNMQHPLVGLWGNPLIFLLDNFVPPFFPAAGWWNQHALTLLPQAIVKPMVANFEAGFHLLWELPSEDWVGIGFGLSCLIVISLVTAWRIDRQMPRPSRALSALLLPVGLRWAVLLAAWAALGAYCVKSGMVNGARLIAPYYPLLLPLLLISPSQALVVRKRWWSCLTAVVLLLALAVLVLNPGRPLWPAKTILGQVVALRPGQRLFARALSVYTVQANRSDPLANVRALLPPGLATVGFLASTDDMDISLWRPYFTRRVEHVLLSDTPEQLRQRQLKYIVVGGLHLAQTGTRLDEWLTRNHAELMATATATIKVAEGPQSWYVVRLTD